MYAADTPEPMPESEVSLADIEAAVAGVASTLDAHFVAAGEALTEIYTRVEALVTALESVTSALDREAADAAIDTMRAIADRLERLPGVQALRQTALARIAQSTGPLRSQVHQVKRTLDFLRICGMNIRVAAAGRHGFSAFADTMSARLDVGEQEISGIGAEIDQLTLGIPALIDVDHRLAEECTKVIPHVPRKLAADAAALQEHQTRDADRAARVAQVARTIRAKVAAAIGAMQIGDITRQRLEHIAGGVGALIALGDQDTGHAPETLLTVNGHMAALLAAQLGDALEAFDTETRRLAENLQSIAPDAAALLDIQAEDAGAGGVDKSTFLAALEHSVADVNAVTAQLHEADLQAQALGGATSDTAERLAQRLKTVHRVTHDVHLMAWNTDLRCYRLGDEGKALATVAVEIRGFAATLSTISSEIRGAIGALMEAIAALRDPDGERRDGPADALARSLACIRDGAQRIRAGLDGLGADAATVTRLLETTTEQMNAEVQFGDALRAVLTQLMLFAAPTDAPEPDAAALLDRLLDAMARSYTMASERVVHRRFTLAGDDADTQAAALLEGDDEDDGLF